MIYEYQTTFADFMAAQKLFRTLTLKRRIWFFLWIWIMPVVGVAALLLLLWDTQFNHFRLLSPVMGGVCAALAWLGIFTAIRRPFQMRSLYKQMKNGRADDAPLAAGIESGELIARVPGMSEGRFQPAAVGRLMEDDAVAIVMVRKKLFLMFPKRILPEPFFEELRRWIGSDPVPLDPR